MRIRILGMLALALCMAGCAELKTMGSAVSTAAGISVPQKDVAAAVQAFNTAEQAATHYLQLPTCQAGQTTLKNGCKTRSGVLLIAKDMRAGRAARDALWTASKASPDGSGPRALLSAVIAGVTALNSDVNN